MKLLALETSTEYCSVALWLDGVELLHKERVGQKHSVRLMAMLDEVLREGGLQLSQLDGIAFGAGPGSFTGVRIACGVAQGLALGADLPVVGINTLQAVAEGSGHARVVAALDARMAEVYFAVYEKTAFEKSGHEQNGGQWQAVIEPCLCLPQDAPMLNGAGWHGAGSGFAAHGDILRQRYQGQLAGVNADCIPLADAVARLAAPMFAAGKGMDAAQAMPLYLRDKVAFTTREREAL